MIEGYLVSMRAHIFFILPSVSVMTPLSFFHSRSDVTTRSKSPKHHSPDYFSTSDASVDVM